MSVIKAENWDGVTAPAIPSGWTVDTTQLATGTAVKRSSPNALSLGSYLSTIPYQAAWATLDGNSGNVSISCYFNSTLTDSNLFSVLGRMSTTAFASTANGYGASIKLTGGATDQARIFKTAAGTRTTLGSALTGTSLFAAASWYQIVLTLLGSSFTMTVVRDSDGYWLRNDGVWVAGVAYCCTATDSTYTGQGYAGLYIEPGALAENMYADDWELDSASGLTLQYKPQQRPENRAYWV